MTKLESAFAAATKLPQEDQDALAQWILEELGSENRWSAAFEGSVDALGTLAAEALHEHEAGSTKPLDIDKL